MTVPESLSPELVWWITAIEGPLLGGLFWLFWKSRRELQEALAAEERRAEQRAVEQRDALAAFKLEVARHYASVVALKEAEARLTHHLGRIEKKLDRFSACETRQVVR